MKNGSGSILNVVFEVRIPEPVVVYHFTIFLNSNGHAGGIDPFVVEYGPDELTRPLARISGSFLRCAEGHPVGTHVVLEGCHNNAVDPWRGTREVKPLGSPRRVIEGGDFLSVRTINLDDDVHRNLVGITCHERVFLQVDPEGVGFVRF